MSDMSNTEKRSFERFFSMSSGHVLDFSNRTFEEFVLDSVGKSIYDSKYDNASGSKANRLRAFWTIEPNYLVAKLLGDMLQYATETETKPDDKQIVANCRRIVQRLSLSVPISDMEAIHPITDEKSFNALANSVKEAIEKNEPELGIDRLHTFVVKFMREVCRKHGIAAERDKPLHSLVGEYVKTLKAKGHIESEMTERILKSSISNLEAFNRVRNEHSLAHDNQVLNYDESLLIFSHVSSVIRLMHAVERRISAVKESEATQLEEDDDLPF